MSITKTHLSLNVKDVEKSAHWYEVFFGVPTHKRRPGYANFDLDQPALKLALQQIDAGTGGPLNHLGILVPNTEEVLAAKTRLEEAGLITFSEENVTCCYAKQDKIWVRDPDGNAWEVYALLDDMQDDDHDDHAHGEVDASQCCQTQSFGDCECQAEKPAAAETCCAK
ncbi:MAG: VOC family protein [Fimbriimonadaceae bacterium]|nr:VOC family protein [Fimbriimonadaceae bacterium]